MSINNRNRKEKASGQQENVWIYGRHASIAALANPERKILRILSTKNSLSDVEMFKGRGQIEVVEARAIESHLPKDSTHQGIAVQAKPLPDVELEDIFTRDSGESHEKCIVIILDQVTDPHNVGAILRSAAAFNAAAVIMTRDNSPKESTALAKAASGALEAVPLVKVTNLAASMKYLKDCGFWCIGLDGGADKSIAETNGYDKVALVMGAEGSGLRRLTLENCDLMAKLPISDKVESLNVSNAAAISLYEISK